MKTIQVHPLSLALGLLLGGGLLAATGMQAPQGWSALPQGSEPNALRIVGIPDPRDMLVIRQESGPYVVPPGRTFVLTALGNNTTSGSADLAVDGVQELIVGFFGSADGPSVVPVAPGFTAPAGATIQVSGVSARAWGYLVGG